MWLVTYHLNWCSFRAILQNFSYKFSKEDNVLYNQKKSTLSLRTKEHWYINITEILDYLAKTKWKDLPNSHQDFPPLKGK